MKLWMSCLALGLGLAACGEDSTEVANAAGSGDQSTGAAGTGSEAPAEPDCVENPVTHLDIINACSSYARVRKAPQLTLLNPDGTLPPP